MEEKVIPQCTHARKCGGCQLQHMSYEQQLRHKQSRMIRLLGRFGHVEDIIGMENPLHYRNKVHAALGLDSRRKPVAGIYRSGSHEIIPVESCLISDNTANSIILSVRKLLPEFKIQVYDERSGTGWLRHILVRRGFKTGETMLVLVAVSPIFKLQKPFLKKLLSMHPEINTVVLNINDRFGPVVLGDREKIIYGDGYIEDELCGLRFRISSRSFYQINPVQTERLYSKAIELAELSGKETVLDAYCGVGTIGLCAANKAKQIIGVELNKDAVRDAIANAKLNKIKNCWFTAADAGEYMERMAKDGHRPDVVFMDPPRSGSDRRFIDSLIRTKPSRIIYISCGPDTLERDLKLICGGGYKVRHIQPVDMFPYTEHVECVVSLSR